MSVFSYTVSFFEAISNPYGEFYFQEACKIFSKQDRLVL